MTDGLSASDVALLNGNGNNGMFGDGAWWIVLFLIFGWGRNGWGNGYGDNGGSSIKDQYVLSSDFATIQRQLSDGFNSIDNALDAQNTGICNLGYTQLDLNNRTNVAIMQGFNDTQRQLADCCCTQRSEIKDVNYTIATTGGDIKSAIKDCCCDTEKQFMQTRFDNAQYNCATLQAIDKVGDRIIDYLANEKAQTLRDENQALRLSASQQAQNAYLVNTLRPAPVPAFAVPAPYQYGNWNNGCGCNGIN